MAKSNSDNKSASAGAGLPAGTRIDKYEIIERVGAGGQSVVYKGRDVLLDRIVAVKQISAHLGADERFIKRFRAEAKILAQLGGERSNIVAVHDLIEHEQGLFIVMEYVEGHTLHEVLSYQQFALPVEAALDILLHVAHGLRVAHAAGVVHRDIKPGNIIVTRSHLAKITDFGVAARAGQDDSLSLGTTRYMAPEVFTAAPVDERADIYSLGFLAYEMLTGRDFFRRIFADVLGDPRSENLRWMKWHSDRDLTPPNLAEINPRVSRTLGDCVARMMAKDLRSRYPSVDDVIEDLEAIRQSPGHGAPVPKTPPAEDVEPELVETADIGAIDELPTSVVPRKPISTRSKVIAAVSIVGLLVIAASVLAVVLGGRASARRRQADAAYSQARQTYDTALQAYDRQGDVAAAKASFADALGRFQAYGRDFGDLPRGTGPPDAWAKLSQAWLAMFDGDFAAAEELLAEAEDMGALAEADIEAFKIALTMRDDAVAVLDQMADALDADDVRAAEAYQRAFEELRAPPLDQDRRAQALAEQLDAARIEQQVRRALSAGDAALNNADVAAAADRADKFAEAMGHLDEAERNFRDALAVAPDDSTARRRLEDVQRARDYVAARAEYVKAMNEGRPLAEQIDALQQAVAARPPSEELRDELATLQAEQAYARAMALWQDDGADLHAVREALAQAVDYKPLPKAVAALDQVSDAIEHNRLVSRAQDARRDGRFAEAVDLLGQAQEIGHRDTTAAALSEARVEMHVAAGDEARRDKRWAEALAHYERARQVRLDDDALSLRVDQLAEQTAREREYYQWLDEGRELLAAGDFRSAVNRLTRAERLGEQHNLDVDLQEARRERRLARYQWEVAKGNAAAADGNTLAALGFYRMAQNLIDTPEIRQLISELSQ